MKIVVTLVFVSLLVILQYDLWVGEGSFTSAWQLQEQITSQRAENERLQVRNDALTAEVSDLKSGLSAIEERARSELGMIKQGETFVQIIDLDNNKD